MYSFFLIIIFYDGLYIVIFKSRKYLYDFYEFMNVCFDIF